MKIMGENFISINKSGTSKSFYNIVITELLSFIPDEIYNALEFMLNTFVQLKLVQCLKMNYFETLDQ
jgi:hypothetical protein